MTISDSIIKLEKREANIRTLCKEILATLKLEQNKEYLPDKLLYLAESWEKRFEHIMNEYGIK